MKMISYKRIIDSEGIDVHKTENSMECFISRYYHFKETGFRYQAYFCNVFHDFSMTIQNLSNFFMMTVKNIECRVYIVSVD